MSEPIETPEAELLAPEATTTEEKKIERYSFDAPFQTKIAALAVRDLPFVQRTEGLIKPEYFENEFEARAVDMVLRFYAKYKKIPAGSASLAMCIKDDAANKVLRADMVAPFTRYLKDVLLTTEIADRDFVVDKVAEFARNQAVERAIEESIHKLSKRDFDGISAVMRKALDVGAHADWGAYDYAAEIKTRTDERLERAAGKLPPTGVTTGYPAIDVHLYHRGWGFRELSVLMGGAKAGKTTALIDFGVAACGSVHRYNVLYITLEVSQKIIAERMDANISEQIIFELGSHIHDVKDKVAKFMERAGKFMIHEAPSGAFTAADLRRLIERYKSKGIKFDLVIVDYADLMAPERWTDNDIANSKSVYVNLRGLAMQENLAMLTATQTNREGAKAAVARMDHVAEDFNKVRIADVIISINKTEEERARGEARLYFAACRNQKAGFSIRIRQELERMKFVAGVIGEE